jgi:hypothetical protein
MSPDRPLRLDLVRGQLQPQAVGVLEVDRLRDDVVLELERDPAAPEIVLGAVEVLAIDAKRDMAQPDSGIAVWLRLQRESASVGHERDRRVTPCVSVLALESENVSVPAVRGLLVGDAQRDVIQALYVKGHG